MCMDKNSNDCDILSLNECNLNTSDEEIIVGITICRKLTFNKYILKTYVKKQAKNWVHF